MLSTIKPIMNKIIQGIIILYLALCSSCALISRDPSPASTLAGQAGAELLFLKGDFDAALTGFERLSQTAVTAEERSQALYGLACTRMMMARTGEQLAKAIDTVQKWDEEKGNMPFSENRRLLVSALKHQGEYLAKKSREQALQEKKKNSLIANQQQKITQLAETVEKLQKQLDELEAIDENFQEKRKSL